MLADIVFRLGDHRAVLDSVMRAFAHAATENATTTLASISSKAADTTFRRLVQEGVVQPRMSPVDRLFGIVATGDFCMAIALQNWVPQQSEAATELAAMVQHISFLTESGKLNVPAPAKALLQGMAAAADGDDDNDYDSLMRGAARAVAEARDATFKFTEDDGTVNDWQEFVRKTVHMVAKQGHKQFSAVDFSNLTGAIFKFGRLQNSRDLELRAALGQPGGSHRQEVRGAGSVPTVLALNAPHPCSNPACNRGLRAHHAVCFGCRASKGKQWRCSLCEGGTRPAATPSRGGAPAPVCMAARRRPPRSRRAGVSLWQPTRRPAAPPDKIPAVEAGAGAAAGGSACIKSRTTAPSAPGRRRRAGEPACSCPSRPPAPPIPRPTDGSGRGLMGRRPSIQARAALGPSTPLPQTWGRRDHQPVAAARGKPCGGAAAEAVPTRSRAPHSLGKRRGLPRRRSSKLKARGSSQRFIMTR